MYIYLHTVDLCELMHRHNKKVAKIKKNKTWNSSAQNASSIVKKRLTVPG